MNKHIKSFFRKEPYPSLPEEWDNPENTVFREFYLTCSPDFAILYRLVKEHMSDKGNEGVTRYRLMKLLHESECRSSYLQHKRRKYPHTWRIRWRIQRFRQFLHRRFRTRFFRNQVELSLIAKEAVKKIMANHQ